MFTELMLRFLNLSQNSTSCRYYQLTEGEFEMAELWSSHTQVSLRRVPFLVSVDSYLSFVPILHCLEYLFLDFSVFLSRDRSLPPYFPESRCPRTGSFMSFPVTTNTKLVLELNLLLFHNFKTLPRPNSSAPSSKLTVLWGLRVKKQSL